MVFEMVHFRFLICPECSHNICWVNPRLPSYCPACGKSIYPTIKSSVMISDENAQLKYDPNAGMPDPEAREKMVDRITANILRKTTD